MVVSFAQLAQSRVVEEFHIATRRLARQLGSGDPAVAEAGFAAIAKLYAQLPDDAKATLPKSAALQAFLKWRDVPRSEKTTVVDVRAHAPVRSTVAAPELMAGVDHAMHAAFLSAGTDKRAWLYRAARLLIAADKDTLGSPAVKDKLYALSQRCTRLGEDPLAKALALAAAGKPEAAKKLLHQRKAQLAPKADVAMQFGKVTAERAGDVVRINGAEIPASEWAQIEAARDRTLALYQSALGKNAIAHKRIGNLSELRRFLMLGRSEAERAGIFADKKALYEKRGPLIEQLQALKASGKKVVLYLEGHDAAGKSSSAQGLLIALKEAGYEIETRAFKAPSEEERKQHWLQRFQKSVDENPGVMVWDRGPAGNWAYGSPPPSALQELEAFERGLKDTVMLKLNLRAEPERQAATFGKRWARALIAAELLENPTLDAQTRADLTAIGETTLSPNDLPAYANFAAIDAKFNAFVDSNTGGAPWVRIDTTSRAVARERALDALATAVSSALA